MLLSKRFFRLALLIAASIIFLDLIRVAVLINLSRTRVDDSIAYQQIKPVAKFKILVLGDSTAVGTGSLNPRDSVAGRFGRDFPQAHIVNLAFNGQKIHQLAASVDPKKLGTFDLVVVQIGANDIIRFTNLKDVEGDLNTLLIKLTQISPKVVLLHSGDVGSAPIFPKLLKGFWTQRSLALRELYKRYAQKYHVLYVDLLAQLTDDIFLKDIKRFYCQDLLHPSGDGYGVWYQAIRRQMQEAGMSF